MALCGVFIPVLPRAKLLPTLDYLWMDLGQLEAESGAILGRLLADFEPALNGLRANSGLDSEPTFNQL